MGSNNGRLRPVLCEKCVSADGRASGLELIAKGKDGVNSHGIDDPVIGYVSIRPHRTRGWRVRVEASHT